MNICVIGTGYVGLVSGTCFSEVGNHVTCVDLDADKIEKLKQSIIPIYEPGLKELVQKNSAEGRLKFTTDLQEGMEAADVVIIAVGTPPKENGEADLRFVKNVAKSIGENLNGYKVIVTKSTVPVGTGSMIKRIIQETSDGHFEFDVASNPEFLREGSAVKDTMEMERAVIGVESEKAERLLKKLHEPFTSNIIASDVETAEIIKYASNAFLATKISFMNDIANLSEKFNANVDLIAKGMGADSRIGPQFLNAGIGYGGSCFPKDVSALINIADSQDVSLDILKAVEDINKKQRLRMIDKLKKAFDGDLSNKKIAVLGLAFKPNTDDMREAPSLTVIPELQKLGAEVVAFDPIAAENAKKEIDGLKTVDDMYVAIEGADCIAILTEWDEIKQLDLEKAKQLLKQPVIIDGRNIFKLEEMDQHGYYYDSIGRTLVQG
ncbi:UDP-glucose dehydrogenase family protein [Pseudalkalibacillus sp. Hm43]|uniref:UDP-glucose dehydrogenase family protein n=1 Tax=Pseudalkalibacillus sp. Hm43 TaxID=3450742 RepID=UPI003F43AFF4